jgi:hypothetical protein
MSTGKQSLTKTRSMMIRLLEKSPMRSAYFEKVADENCISHSSFFEVLKKEKKKAQEKKMILRWKQGQMTIYFLPCDVWKVWDIISAQNEYQSAVGRLKFDKWKEHSNKVERTLKKIKTQMPEITLDQQKPFVFTVEHEDEGVPFEHLFEHDELGPNFRPAYEALKKNMLDFENARVSLFNEISTLLKDQFQTIDRDIEPDNNITKAMYNLLVRPDYFNNYEYFKGKKLVHETGFYSLFDDNKIIEGWLRYRGISTVDQDIAVNKMKNTVLDQIFSPEYLKCAQILIRKKDSLIDEINEFIRLLARILLMGPFKPCRSLLNQDLEIA